MSLGGWFHGVNEVLGEVGVFFWLALLADVEGNIEICWRVVLLS